MTDDDRRETGRRVLGDVLRKAAPEAPGTVLGAALDWLYADVWARPGLTRKERRLITLTCLAFVGGREVETHVEAALSSGDLTPQELEELALHLAGYAGFPRAAAFDRAAQQVRAAHPGA